MVAGLHPGGALPRGEAPQRQRQTGRAKTGRAYNTLLLHAHVVAKVDKLNYLHGYYACDHITQ